MAHQSGVKQLKSSCPGPQTLWGYQLYNNQQTRVGLAAGIGGDLPAAHVAWLQAMGVDTSGLLDTPGRDTPRAWQICEADGRRTQVKQMLTPSPRT